MQLTATQYAALEYAITSLEQDAEHARRNEPDVAVEIDEYLSELQDMVDEAEVLV